MNALFFRFGLFAVLLALFLPATASGQVWLRDGLWIDRDGTIYHGIGGSGGSGINTNRINGGHGQHGVANGILNGGRPGEHGSIGIAGRDNIFQLEDAYILNPRVSNLSGSFYNGIGGKGGDGNDGGRGGNGGNAASIPIPNPLNLPIGNEGGWGGAGGHGGKGGEGGKGEAHIVQTHIVDGGMMYNGIGGNGGNGGNGGFGGNGGNGAGIYYGGEGGWITNSGDYYLGGGWGGAGGNGGNGIGFIDMVDVNGGFLCNGIGGNGGNGGEGGNGGNGGNGSNGITFGMGGDGGDGGWGGAGGNGGNGGIGIGYITEANIVSGTLYNGIGGSKGSAGRDGIEGNDGSSGIWAPRGYGRDGGTGGSGGDGGAGIGIIDVANVYGGALHSGIGSRGGNGTGSGFSGHAGGDGSSGTGTITTANLYGGNLRNGIGGNGGSGSSFFLMGSGNDGGAGGDGASTITTANVFGGILLNGIGGNSGNSGSGIGFGSNGVGGAGGTGTGTIITANVHDGGTLVNGFGGIRGSSTPTGNFGAAGTGIGYIETAYLHGGTLRNAHNGGIGRIDNLIYVGGEYWQSGSNTGNLVVDGRTGIGAGTGIGRLQIGNGSTTSNLARDIVLSNNSSVTFDHSNNFTRNQTVSGNGSLTKTGTGTLTLTGDNTYSGGTMVNAGILAGNIANNTNLTVAAGATYDGTGAARSVNALNGNGTVVNSHGLTVQSGTFGGVISGAGGLTTPFIGILTLTGTNTYDGGTTVRRGTLQIGNGGTTGSVAGNIVLEDSQSNVTFNRSDAVTYGGVISGTGTVTQNGLGTLILTGDNTFTGTTSVNEGHLQIGNGGTTGSVAGNIYTRWSNSRITFNRSDEVIYGGNISGSGILTQAGAGTLVLTGNHNAMGFALVGGIHSPVGTIVNAGSTLQIGNGGTTGNVSWQIDNSGNVTFNRSNAVTYNSVISGTGSVTQAGTGTLTLTGNNTYTGDTNVNAGTLQVGTATNRNASINNVSVNNTSRVDNYGTIGHANVRDNARLENFANANIGTMNLLGGTVNNGGRIDNMTYTGGAYNGTLGSNAGSIDRLNVAGKLTGNTWGTVNDIVFDGNGSGIIHIAAFVNDIAPVSVGDFQVASSTPSISFSGIQATRSVDLTNGRIAIDVSDFGTYSSYADWSIAFFGEFDNDIFSFENLFGTSNVTSWDALDYFELAYGGGTQTIFNGSNWMAGWAVTADGFTGAAVPEPATLAIIGLGLVGLGWTRRRNGQRQ